MNSYIRTIQLDFLQRTRGYGFLVVLAVGLYMAYTFIPAPDATYSTVKFGKFVGDYNSAWIGYVTAIMGSVFLSLTGFYLINNSIGKDIETRVGSIISATRVSNVSYLLSKALSNFLVLFVIMLFIFAMSIVMFFLYNRGLSLEIKHFLVPYGLITVPTLLFVSCLAVVFEVFFKEKSSLINGVFFVLFFVLLMNSSQNPFSDIFGIKYITNGIEQQLSTQMPNENFGLSIGYNLASGTSKSYFDFQGLVFESDYVLSRIFWAIGGLILVFVSAGFFHRFNIRERIKGGKKSNDPEPSTSHISIDNLPDLKTDFGVIPLMLAELKLLIRKGPKWLWILNLAGMIALLFSPLTVAHQIILPVLWLLQIHRWSDLVTKEKYHRMEHFSAVSYRPVNRLMLSQAVAAVSIAIGLAVPLILRYAVLANFAGMISVVLGCVFIVLLAITFGVLTKSKRLFEILFIILTYVNINAVPYADYFGALHSSSFYLLVMVALISVLICASVLKRKFDLVRL